MKYCASRSFQTFAMISAGLGDQEHGVNEQFEPFQVLIMCPPSPHFPLTCPVYKEQRKSTLFYCSFLYEDWFDLEQ